MQLVGVQGPRQLGDALGVELVQPAAQLDGAAQQLVCALVEGLCAARQLGAALLGGVGTRSSGSHAVGIPAHAGNKELDAVQVFLQFPHAGNVVALLGLQHQLVVDDLLGVGVGDLLQPAHEDGGAEVLDEPQGSFQVAVGLGGGEVERQVQPAGLELRGLGLNGAHHLLAARRQRALAQLQHLVQNGIVVVPGHGGVDEAVLHQGLAGRIQHAVGHLLGPGGEGGVVGRQGVKALHQLAKAAVQLVCTVQQLDGTAGQSACAVHQLGRAGKQLLHGVVQLGDAVGQGAHVAKVEHVALPQRLGAGGGCDQNLRGGQVFHVGFHGHGVLQIVLQSRDAGGQQAVKGLPYTGQGDESRCAGFGGAFQQAVRGVHVGGLLPEEDPHGGDKGRHDGALFAVHGERFSGLVGELHRHHQVAALAQQLFQRLFHAVQRVGDGGGKGQLLVRIALVVDIGVGGVPDKALAVLGKLRVALGVDDVGQGGAVGDRGKTARVIEMLADGGGADGAVCFQHGVHRLVFGECGLGGRRSGQGHPGGEGERQRRTGNAKRRFHGMRAAGRTMRMTAVLMSAPREMSRQMQRISSILLMTATPKVAAKKVRPLVRMLWLHCSSACWAAARGVRPKARSSR